MNITRLVLRCSKSVPKERKGHPSDPHKILVQLPEVGNKSKRLKILDIFEHLSHNPNFNDKQRSRHLTKTHFLPLPIGQAENNQLALLYRETETFFLLFISSEKNPNITEFGINTELAWIVPLLCRLCHQQRQGRTSGK